MPTRNDFEDDDGLIPPRDEDTLAPPQDAYAPSDADANSAKGVLALQKPDSKDASKAAAPADTAPSPEPSKAAAPADAPPDSIAAPAPGAGGDEATKAMAAVQALGGGAPSSAGPVETPDPLSGDSRDSGEKFLDSLDESQQQQFNIMPAAEKAALVSGTPEKQAAWLKGVEPASKVAPAMADAQVGTPPELQGDKGGQRVVVPPESGGQASDQKFQVPDSAHAIDAITSLGKLDADVARQAAPLYQKTADELSQNADEMLRDTNDTGAAVAGYQQKMKDLQAQKDAMLSDPKQFGPSAYWHSLGTGQQIMYGIGIALNTIVSAVSRGRVPNIAWDYFNGAIQRDSQAQFAKLQNAQQGIAGQQNLATLALHNLHDHNAALAYVNFEKANATAKQIEALAAKTGDQRVMAQTQLEVSKWLMGYQKAFIDGYAKSVSAQRAAQATQLAAKNQTVTDSRGNAAVVPEDVAKSVHEKQAQARALESVAADLQRQYPNGPGRLDSDAQANVRLTLAKTLGLPPEQLDKVLPNRVFTNADWSFVKSMADQAAAQADAEARGSMH